jgi:hypothetical protein
MIVALPEHPEERLARLLRELPPAPPAWVAAAQALPAARRALDEIEDCVLADAPSRATQTRRLEAALEEVGFEPTTELVQALERLLARQAGER